MTARQHVQAAIPARLTPVLAVRAKTAADSLDMLIQRLKKTKTNTEFLLSLNR